MAGPFRGDQSDQQERFHFVRVKKLLAIRWLAATATLPVRAGGAESADHRGLNLGGIDKLFGDDGVDHLMGGGGNDTLNGGTGADLMEGNWGNDTYVVDDGGDLLFEIEGNGTDLVLSSINWSLGANFENLTLTGSANINGTGNGLNNSLFGNTGNNILTGGIGNDKINGGAGADAMIGGAGNDSYVVDNVGDTVVELLDEGNDSVKSSVSFTLGANIEILTLTGLADINGTGNALNNVITGNDGANTLKGGDGDDLITGGAGNDIMIGGAGDDTYSVEDAGDKVTEGVAGGTDLVNATVSYILHANVENLNLKGSDDLNGTGNALANVINGNSGDNALLGREGDDRLVGGAGNDSLDGGTSDDTLLGGEGNDSLTGGLGIDNMTGGDGDDTYAVDDDLDIVNENNGTGIDTVRASVSWILGVNVENLVQTGANDTIGIGNALANVMTGNNAANFLDGGEGDDTLDGGLGNDGLFGGEGADTLIGGKGNDFLEGGESDDLMSGGEGSDAYWVDDEDDTVVELAGTSSGLDTVFATVSFTLTDNVEDLFLVDSKREPAMVEEGNNPGTGAARPDANISGTGNCLKNLIVGTSGENTLSGLGGNDTIYGEDGSDLLLGGSGADVLDGGSDDDVLSGGDGSDTLTGGEGADTFRFTNEDIHLSSRGGKADLDKILDLDLWKGGDIIDLSAIDADVSTVDDDDFTFVAKFSKTAGEAMMTYSVNNDITTLQLDVDGDGIADLRIAMEGDHRKSQSLIVGVEDNESGWIL